MRHVTVYKYEVSVILLVASVAVLSAAMAAAYYWASRTVPFSVEEPLTVANYPTIFTIHPGENNTLDIAITNSANINYSVVLTIVLNDTTYQQSYVQCSNNTYNIVPGSNQIQAWIDVDRRAPPVTLELTVEFHRE